MSNYEPLNELNDELSSKISHHHIPNRGINEINDRSNVQSDETLKYYIFLLYVSNKIKQVNHQRMMPKNAWRDWILIFIHTTRPDRKHRNVCEVKSGIRHFIIYESANQTFFLFSFFLLYYTYSSDDGRSRKLISFSLHHPSDWIEKKTQREVSVRKSHSNHRIIITSFNCIRRLSFAMTSHE